MIRWKYLGPRSLLALVLLLGIVHGLPWLLRWTLIHSGESVTGARVDIGKVDANLFSGRVAIHDIAVTDPSIPERNLWQADAAILDLDASQLLRRRFVVTEGRIDGMRIHSPRQAAGIIERSPTDLEQRTGLSSAVGDWFTTIAAALSDDFEATLQTPAVAKELLSEWPRQLKLLQIKATQLRQRSSDLTQKAIDCRENPLRHLPEIEHITREIEQLQQDWTSLTAEAEGLRDLLPRQRQRLLAAKEQDLERLQQLAKLAKFDASDWSDHLLGRETSRQATQIVEWLKWARSFLPLSTVEMVPERARGRLVEFTSSEPTPEVLIQTLALNGEIQIQQSPFQFIAIARNLTPQPKRLGKPAVVVAQLSGRGVVQLTAVVDRTQSVPHDRFVVEGEAIPQAECLLGDARGFRFEVAPGPLAVHAEFHRHGEHLDGSITLRRHDVEIRSELPDSIASCHWTRSLVAEIDKINELDVTLTCAGKSDDLHWSVSSEVGQQLARIVNRVIQGEVETRRAELVAKLDRILEAQLARHRDLLAEGQAQLSTTLDLGNAELADLKRQVIQDTGVLQHINRADQRSIEQALRKAGSFLR